MMRNLLLVFTLTSSLLYGDSKIVWEKDIHKAMEISQREKKPLLVFFTGSDCSGWGMKMKNEILSSLDFMEKTKEKFVFVEIDFPEHKTLDTHLAEQNRALKEKWKVHEIPRLILVDAEGREIARFGSTTLAPKEFGEDLLSILAQDQALTCAMKQLSTASIAKLEELYKLARELERKEELAVILEAGIERGGLFFLLEKYRLLVEEGKHSEKKAFELRQRLLMADPQNEKKVLFSLALIDFQRLSNEKPTNPFIAIRPLEEYLKQFGEKDLENLWRLEMMIAQFYLDCDEWRVALRHAEIALQSAPTTKKEEIARSVEYIRSEAILAGK